MKLMSFLHNMEELCNLSEVLWRKNSESNYQDSKYGDCMGTVRRVILSMEIYGKISLEIVWGFHGEITRQSPY